MCKDVCREKTDDCVQLEINFWKVSNVKSKETSKYEMCDEIGEIFKLKEAENTKYLGDVISHDASNTENIKKRKEKGYVIINQIKTILEEGFYGKYHFEAAILLRESLFINSILLNSEVRMNLNKLDQRTVSCGQCSDAFKHSGKKNCKETGFFKLKMT